jgi:UrcA family protein
MPNLHRLPHAAVVLAAACLGLSACATSGARGDTGFPDIHMAVAEIDVAAPEAGAALARRIEATARDYCGVHGERLTPAHRRGQPSYCLRGVRAEIVAALPADFRARLDAERRGQGAP